VKWSFEYLLAKACAPSLLDVYSGKAYASFNAQASRTIFEICKFRVHTMFIMISHSWPFVVR
jgi:hypothetical protein